MGNKNTIYPDGMSKKVRGAISVRTGYIALASLRDSYSEEYRSAVATISKDPSVKGVTHKAMVLVSKSHLMEYKKLRLDTRDILVNNWIATQATPEELQVCSKALEERKPLVKEVPRKGFFARMLSLVGLRNVN